MSGFARVDAFEPIKNFRTALIRFAESIEKGITEADADIQKTSLWLKQDQTSYWRNEMRKRTEQVHRARLALNQAKRDKGPLGGHYSYVDERKALALAERRYEEAQQKLAAVKRWIVQLEQEMFDYKGQVQGAVRAIDHDIPRAAAMLERVLLALEKYAQMELPDQAPDSIANKGESSIARPVDDDEDEPTDEVSP